MTLTRYTARFVTLRWAFDGACRRLLPARYHAAVPHVWDLLGNLYIIGWLVRLMMTPVESGYLHMWQLDAPEHYYQGLERIEALDAYLTCEAAWYIGGIINAWLHGDAEATPMIVHHVVALLLIKTAILCNITRLGIALVPFLLFSNPLLHAAKAMHSVGMQRCKDVAFGAFAIVFFASRIVAFPLVYMRVAIVDVGRWWMRDRVVLYWCANAMLACIYVLQVYWFYRIVGVIKRRHLSRRARRAGN